EFWLRHSSWRYSFAARLCRLCALRAEMGYTGNGRTFMYCPPIRILTAALLIATAASGTLPAQGKEASAEKLLFDSANRERVALGRAPLKGDEALAVAARVHAKQMAERREISHQFPGEPDLLARIRVAGARFVALAENVAEGPDVAGLHGQWMKSPPHRE